MENVAFKEHIDLLFRELMYFYRIPDILSHLPPHLPNRHGVHMQRIKYLLYAVLSPLLPSLNPNHLSTPPVFSKFHMVLA